ncbi:S41 family peptidase [Pedobacter terrae]|uniref:S41 family peptidase n=1 Tax=Pedobacter terrae TaxID=405671 RepID=UPI002FF60833
MENGQSSSDTYKGKVVVIVNATSQSQAEYTTIAFQSSPNVKVIGSTTACADGNVSSIVLPGGLNTMISGLDVFYPDGSPTQRVAVKIDYKIYPTITGISTGKDELLDKAIEVLNASW